MLRASSSSQRGGPTAAASAARPGRGVLSGWRSPIGRPAILLTLATSAGFLDAASYLGLGHVFTANMTGNTVLLAIAAVQGRAAAAGRSLTALAGFAVGVALGAAMIRPQGRWPGRAAAIFWMESLLLAVLLVGWNVAGPGYLLIAASALAMGAQSVAVRASHVRGVNTTYMTSTFQSAVARVILRARDIDEDQGGAALPGSAWALYGLGALTGVLAERGWGASCVAVPLALVGAVTVAAAARRPATPRGGRPAPGRASARRRTPGRRRRAGRWPDA